jgi:LmbE family N-acetylglucosaminyl deacetylase
MDDEVIACGGTLLLLIAQGAAVHITFVSDSSAGIDDPAVAANLRSIRQSQAERVSDYMGFTETTELAFPDGRLFEHEVALTEGLAREIERIDPDLILCPFPADAHSDHMSCAWGTARATSRLKWRGSILAYEVWTPLWPNVGVDITHFAARKAEAIRFYESEIVDRDYTGATLGLNRYRGLVHAISYAEAFYKTDVAGFTRLAAMLDEV